MSDVNAINSEGINMAIAIASSETTQEGVLTTLFDALKERAEKLNKTVDLTKANNKGITPLKAVLSNTFHVHTKLITFSITPINKKQKDGPLVTNKNIADLITTIINNNEASNSIKIQR